MLVKEEDRKVKSYKVGSARRDGAAVVAGILPAASRSSAARSAAPSSAPFFRKGLGLSKKSRPGLPAN